MVKFSHFITNCVECVTQKREYLISVEYQIMCWAGNNVRAKVLNVTERVMKRRSE